MDEQCSKTKEKRPGKEGVKLGVVSEIMHLVRDREQIRAAHSDRDDSFVKHSHSIIAHHISDGTEQASIVFVIYVLHPHA